MLEHVQIIEEHGQAKFAVIDFEEYLSIKALLSEPEKLANYLDYLHMQSVKQASSKRYTLAGVKTSFNESSLYGIGDISATKS